MKRYLQIGHACPERPVLGTAAFRAVSTVQGQAVQRLFRTRKLIFSTVVHLIEDGTTVQIGLWARVAKVRVFALPPPDSSGVNMDDFSFRLRPE